jgi:hypothetical protein
MLTEAHVPFDILADSLVTETPLSGFKFILVANIVHMTPEVAAALRQYVSEGGALLFTHSTATLDFHGEPLAQPSFGYVSIVRQGPYSVSFIKPSTPASDTLLRVRETVEFNHGADVQFEATVTPPALDVTPDQWITHNVMPGPDGESPAAVTGSFGRGHYIYIAPRIFAEYIRQGLPSIREWVMALIAPHYQPSIWLEGSRAVEAVYQRQGADVVIALINGLVDKPRAGGHGTIFDRGWVGMTETMPVAGLRLHLRGRREVTASDLGGNALSVTAGESETIVEVPRLDRYGLVRLSGFY